MNSDEYYISKTFELAKKAQGKTSPNPMVGCVIVKDSKIIASGFHRKAGFPHAEVDALNKIKGKARSTTLYVNLEPCFHWGKTPPCVDKIISCGIKKVVISVKDPNPLVCGRSIAKLRKKGIEVKVGVLNKEAARLNEVFFVNMRQKRPFLAVKVAQTLDGKIANARGESKWITSGYSRSFARRLRSIYDAVLVGANTVLKDNPSLTCGKRLIKVILDPYLRISKEAKLFREAKAVFIFTGSEVDKAKLANLRDKAIIIQTGYSGRGFDLRKILKILYSYGIMSVLIEGGSLTLGGFFDAKLADKLYIFLSPSIMGKRDALSSIGGQGNVSISKMTQIRDAKLDKIGRDLLVTGYPVFK